VIVMHLCAQVEWVDAGTPTVTLHPRLTG